MSNIEIAQLVRSMVREIAPYQSARDEFEDFEAQKIFWMPMKTLTIQMPIVIPILFNAN